MTPLSPHAARFEMERQLVQRAGTCIGVRIFPYPSDGTLALLVAELDDQTDVQVLFQLPWKINPDAYDEARLASLFDLPSVARH